MLEKLNPIILLSCILITVIFSISTLKKQHQKDIRIIIFIILNVISIFYYFIHLLIEIDKILLNYLSYFNNALLFLLSDILLLLVNYLLFIYLEITLDNKNKFYFAIFSILFFTNLYFIFNSRTRFFDNKLYVISIFIYIIIPVIKSIIFNKSYKARKYLIITYPLIYILCIFLSIMYSQIFLDIGLIIILFLEYLFIHTFDFEINSNNSKMLIISKLFDLTLQLNTKNHKFVLLKDGKIIKKDLDYNKYRIFFIKHYVSNHYIKEIELKSSIKYIINSLSDKNKYYNYTFKNNNNDYYQISFIFISLNNIIITIKNANEESMIKNKNKLKLMTNLSHDLRTPLNAILGYTYLISQNPNNKQYIENLRISSNNMLELCNNFLDEQVINSTSAKTKTSIYKLKDIIDETITILTPKLRDKNIIIKLKSNFSLNIYIKIEKTILIQILQNILSNSIKYSKPNSLIVFKLLKNKKKFTFTIKDYGIGMNKKFIKDMFNPFSRDNNTDKIKGYGLGLHITKNLLNRINGKIKVKSQINKGSTFIINIYLNYLDPSKTTILLIEDNIINNKMLTISLQKLGFKIISIINSHKIQKVLKRDINLILLDLYLEKTTGFEVFLQIREYNEKIPVIALSGSTDTEDINKCKSLGFYDYLIKPVDYKFFLVMIFELLNSN